MPQYLAISQVRFELLDSLRQENATSTFFLEKYKELDDSILGFDEYEVRDGLLLHKEKLLLDYNSPLVILIIQECHSTPLGGHKGIQKTMAKVSTAFTWVGMKQAIQKFVKECEICLKNEAFQSSTCGTTLAIAYTRKKYGRIWPWTLSQVYLCLMDILKFS